LSAGIGAAAGASKIMYADGDGPRHTIADDEKIYDSDGDDDDDDVQFVGERNDHKPLLDLHRPKLRHPNDVSGNDDGGTPSSPPEVVVTGESHTASGVEQPQNPKQWTPLPGLFSEFPGLPPPPLGASDAEIAAMLAKVGLFYCFERARA